MPRGRGLTSLLWVNITGLGEGGSPALCASWARILLNLQEQAAIRSYSGFSRLYSPLHMVRVCECACMFVSVYVYIICKCVCGCGCVCVCMSACDVICVIYVMAGCETGGCYIDIRL